MEINALGLRARVDLDVEASLAAKTKKEGEEQVHAV
jgi:hypothetical protein